MCPTEHCLHTRPQCGKKSNAEQTKTICETPLLLFVHCCYYNVFHILFFISCLYKMLINWASADGALAGPACFWSYCHHGGHTPAALVNEVCLPEVAPFFLVSLIYLTDSDRRVTLMLESFLKEVLGKKRVAHFQDTSMSECCLSCATLWKQQWVGQKRCTLTSVYTCN